MNPAHKASSSRFQIRLPSHCKVSWDCFWRFFAAIYLNLFSWGSMLVVNRRLFESNEPSSSLLLFGSPAIPSIPHWFKFAMVCIPQTGILLLFGHDFGIFIPAGCVNSMRKHLFCPQKPYLGGEKRLYLQVLSPKSAFWSTSFFLKGG